MSPVEWYYAAGNKQLGPVSSVELKRLAGDGALQPESLVWREGLAEWTAANNVRGLFDADAKPAAAAENSANPAPMPKMPGALLVPRRREPMRHPVDALLDLLRLMFNAHFVETTAKLFRTCGVYGLPAAMAVWAAFCLISVFMTRQLGPLVSVIPLMGLVILHHAANRCLDAVDRLNVASKDYLSTAALPDCFALLSLLVGVAGLLVSVFVGPALSFYTILSGVLSFFLGIYLTAVALNPTSLGVSIDQEREFRPGEESVSLIAFVLKALLRLTPVAFGAGVVGGTLQMGYACCEALLANGNLSAAITHADEAARTIFVFAALPPVAYAAYLLCLLPLSLWRAVLSLLERNNASANSEESESEESEPA